MKVFTTIKSVLPAAAVAVLALAFGSTSASAATATATFGVSATVQATCLISASSMAFGTYTGTLSSTSTTVSVTCTNTTTYNVGLSAGLATGATVTARKMTGPNSALLNYALYQDSAHTTNWGQTVNTDTVAGTGDGSAQSITVYGQVAAGQYVEPGAYSDTITATITY
jgi:spore coat protein U-like protein